MPDLVLLDIDDRGVATITLNRPDRLNAINLAMRDLLWTYLGACRDHPDVRLIVFRGEGRAFSAGADVSEFGTAPSIMASRDARWQRDVWGLLQRHRCVTIAAMHGYCFGAGLELPLNCDIRVAAEGSTFALPEVTLGYIPSACGTQTLPRTIPPGVAAHMIFSGEAIDAAAALHWGLVHRVAPSPEFETALAEEVDRALADPRGASAHRRRMVTG